MVAICGKLSTVGTMADKLKKLTKSQSLYCAARASGEVPKGQCYLNAFPGCKTIKSARSLYQKLDKQPHIQAEMKRLQDGTETAETLTRQEKRVFLARVVRVNPIAIDPDDAEDPNADLIESVTRRYNGEGDHISTTFRVPSKLSAVEVDNKMAGHNEPDEHNHNHNGGVMLVPSGGANLDDWEKDAVKQQEALKGHKKADSE